MLLVILVAIVLGIVTPAFGSPEDDQWFTQKLDHFSDSNDATWKQRFWNNNEFYKDGGPQILSIGGEGEASSDSVLGFSINSQVAEQLNGNLWGLEHRFYGQSMPLSDQSVKSLAYHSSRQALADLANFIEAQNLALNLTNPSWIVFGCSYPGSLALWLRALYPETVAGAISFSGPIEAKIDFFETYQVIEYAFRNFSPSCGDSIQKTFSEIQAFLEYSEGRKKMNEIFSPYATIDEGNLHPEAFVTFFWNLIQPFSASGQYNNPSMEYICETMANASNNGAENLAKILNKKSFKMGKKAADNNRSWMWQRCTEFGWCETTDGGHSFFGSVIPPNDCMESCKKHFGNNFTLNRWQNAVEQTNALYGGYMDYNGTNVVVVQGTYDPWSGLGLKVATDPSIVIHTIEGGHHCPEDDAIVEIALENIQKWMKTKVNKSIIQKNGQRKTSINDNIKIGIIEQNRDHFSPNDTQKWKQQFWSNSAYAKASGPLFLVICGQNAANPSIISTPESMHVQWAKLFGAELFLLEHRFYGASNVGENLSVENLTYLSSQQALADIAAFIEAINANRTTDPKWIIFGGGYAGSLAAWFKQVHPNHVIGAVASSAPIQAKVDFFEYKQIVENSFREYSPECGDQLSQAIKDLESSMYNFEDRNLIDSVFNPTKSLFVKSPRIKDIQTFYNSLFNELESADIPKVCEIMKNAAQGSAENLRDAAGKCPIKSDYDVIVSDLKNATFGDSYARQQFWQSCTEFGFFQTTDLGYNIFGIAVPIDYFIDLCSDVFGPDYDRSAIDLAIYGTQKRYGGIRHYNATKVAFVNGSNDPWHPLSFPPNDANDSNGIISIFINGSNYCEDMMPSEKPEIKEAQKQIESLLHSWLN